MMMLVSLEGHLLKLVFRCCQALLFTKWVIDYKLEVVIKNLNLSKCNFQGDKRIPVHKIYSAQSER